MSAYEQLIISDKISFYNNLSEKNKKYFDHRVIRFIDNHNFVSREGVKITKEIKLLVAATAVKLTFGYRRFLFSRINTIIIYPNNYFSNITQQYHKGETNPKYRTIALSWEDFKEGLKIENDNLDLGIHEFTHALHFSFLSERSFSASHFKESYKKLLLFLEDKEEQKKLIETGYLREYAYENQYEFLAVLVEHFFESPTKFQNYHPEIYSHVRQILNWKLKH
ncbi:zinc-dependent peptidase [Urechidicola croceus]|uniref:DgsA anti-repressor MtfA n=1 Tax=Urechidicola croceus TaxID=1850246 RepID=A0A1D8PAP5_9FLAO|nr:zinc-dependent peptidase [Urechidicola croceus]AOW21626.1 hypothetical protein LPB138_13465 [Urechidicola croceus]